MWRNRRTEFPARKPSAYEKNLREEIARLNKLELDIIGYIRNTSSTEKPARDQYEATVRAVDKLEKYHKDLREKIDQAKNSNRQDYLRIYNQSIKGIERQLNIATQRRDIAKKALDETIENSNKFKEKLTEKLDLVREKRTQAQKKLKDYIEKDLEQRIREYNKRN